MDDKQAVAPKKRRLSEYHDPDYQKPFETSPESNKYDIQTTATTTTAAAAATSNAKRFKPESAISDVSKEAQRHNILCNIISREFDTELTLKREQLMQIDERLIEARKLLDRLRYAIVSEYYRKQEVPLLTKPDTDRIRGVGSGNVPRTLFTDERDGPQQPLHPALKKIIGKKPKTNVNELLRSQPPERTAAAQAKLTIRARNPAQRRQERRMQKMIREQGIVIDHTKQESQLNIKLEPKEISDDDKPTTSKQAQLKAAALSTQNAAAAATGKVLNSARLNNKTKCYFVVGNTSKYIGGNTADATGGVAGQTLSHKWLLYVQAKDMQQPIEYYIKKVRFHLHHSYRPNDVVDVCSPPFQIARRGWGEFPMRIQLFFHPELQQKPVQLMHNLILDKTQSGLHTLGAETVVEVWLRTTKATATAAAAMKQHAIPNTPSVVSPQKPLSPLEQFVTTNKPRTISITHNKEEIDDDLFAFLNKTEISADIEKIEPTVLVPEPLTCKLSSPLKQQPLVMPHNNVAIGSRPQVPLMRMETATLSTATSALATTTTTLATTKSATTMLATTTTATITTSAISATPTLATSIKKIEQDKPKSPLNTPLLQASNAVVSKPAVVYLPKTNSAGFELIKANNQNNRATILNNNNNNNKSGGTIIVNGRKFMLTNGMRPLNQNTKPATTTIAASNTNGNKLMRLVDAQGKIKFVPVLMNATTKTLSSSNVNGNAIKSNATFTTPLPAKSVNTITAPTAPKQTPPPKNIVFQKEGKLYIIDPMQMKLKQAQRQQQSLLKPQVSLLKQRQPTQTQTQTQSAAVLTQMQVVASDHDYAPVPAQPTITPMPIIHTQQPDYSLMSRGKLVLSNAARCQLERQEFEKRFQRAQNFPNMRAAVEFLLRRLPLYAMPNMTSAKAFLFVSASLEEFESLNGIKQRAQEWLRAKTVQRFLQNHPQLRTLNTEVKEPYWTMREIIMFARFYGFTPTLKTLHSTTTTTTDTKSSRESKISGSAPFAARVKHELQHEQQQHGGAIHYETLSSIARISKWVETQTKRLETYEFNIDDNQLIDVECYETPLVAKKTKTKTELLSAAATSSTSSAAGTTKRNENQNTMYMSTPKHLDNAAQIAVDICKTAGLKLREPESREEIVPGITHASTLTVLSQTLQVFIDKLLRQTVASKLLESESVNEKRNVPQTNSLCPLKDLQITPQDIVRGIAQCKDFEFLTNALLGVDAEQTTTTNDAKDRLPPK